MNLHFQVQLHLNGHPLHEEPPQSLKYLIAHPWEPNHRQAEHHHQPIRKY